MILRNFPLYYSRMRGKISHIRLSEITRLNLTPARKRSLSLLTRPWHTQLAALTGSRPGRSALQHDTVPGYPLQWNRVIRRGFDCTLYFPHTQILGVTKPSTFVFIFPFFYLKEKCWKTEPISIHQIEELFFWFFFTGYPGHKYLHPCVLYMSVFLYTPPVHCVVYAVSLVLVSRNGVVGWILNHKSSSIPSRKEAQGPRINSFLSWTCIVSLHMPCIQREGTVSLCRRRSSTMD